MIELGVGAARDIAELATELAAYGVPVLAGTDRDVPVPPAASLMADLAGHTDARAHTALSALLLARPELAAALAEAEATTAARYGDAAVGRLRSRYQAAVYLQRDWKWRVGLYAGRDPERMLDLPDVYGPGLGLPPADELFGRPALYELAGREGEPVATYEAAIAMLEAVWVAGGPRTYA